MILKLIVITAASTQKCENYYSSDFFFLFLQRQIWSNNDTIITCEKTTRTVLIVESFGARRIELNWIE